MWGLGGVQLPLKKKKPKQTKPNKTKRKKMSKPIKQEKGFLAGFSHLFAATSYSLQGIAAGFRLSLAFRQECFVFLLLCFLLYFFDKPFSTCLASLFMWLIVMSLELINTAIEESLDMISLDYSSVIKAAKDMGSAAVFLFIMFNLAAQLFIFHEDFASFLPFLSGI